jgi:two-component sensor histidine kinase
MLTNAYKYAFDANTKGNIHVELHPGHKKGKAKKNFSTWELIIRDDGKGLPGTFNLETATSMGSQIINALIGQIHAELYITGENGASFRIVFDLPVKE